MDDLETRLDELYAGPPGEFTSRRAALVKDLRAAGDREEAERVGALRRPTKLAGRLNELARERADAIATAIGAEEALAGAQRAMLDGRSSADDLRAATEAEAAAIAALSDDPEVRAAIRAAARRPDERDELRRGRLSHDPEPDLTAGLLLGGPPPAAASPRRPARAAPPEKEPEGARVDELAARRRTKALAEARELARAAAENRRRADDRLASARRDRERAEGARDEAERELASRREAAEGAAGAESRATDEAAEAARLVDEAERVLARLEDDAPA